MGITFEEKSRVFKLDSKSSTYMIGIVDEDGFIGHIYYGKYISDKDMSYLLKTGEQPLIPSINNRERISFMDNFPFEYSTHGVGDYRESCLKVRKDDGTSACNLSYKKHKIYAGKPKLEGLPASFGSSEDCTTLEIVCSDDCIGIEVILIYTVFEELDVIARSVKIRNIGNEICYIEKALSTCVDFEGMDFDVITLHGSWARERHIQRRNVDLGKYSVSSIRGESSHQEHPFMAIVSRETNQDSGEVYGFSFVYSGNFLAEVEGTQFHNTRFVMGINPENFEWKLQAHEEFTTPEVISVFSHEGIGSMTHTYHDFYRKHLIRSKYKDMKRPILINNWEATYFDFNTEKLLKIAEDAAKLGIEMLVMDDGWFGNRNSDDCALGDWFINEDKLKGGLKYLVEEVNKLGMKFGIWFEPEMISPDSDLYREHPDWAIQIKGREAGLARNQYVLDFSRREIRDTIYERMKNILNSAPISYVKWDMNRPLSDLGSSALSSDRQGELSHRYVLGLYEMLEKFNTDFPDILLEGCSGGGARFDPGMLYYCPQIWCSDDTDAIERLQIQEGTAMVYPLSTIGAHVSDCPNHVVGRVTPFETRGYVALAGTFGYELDVTKISEEDKKLIPQQVALYHKYNEIIRNGDYYRLLSYTKDGTFDAWQVVSKDKSESVVFVIQVLNKPNYHSTRLRLKGLNETGMYKIEGQDQGLSGGALMHAGILLEPMSGDFKGKLIYLKRS